MTATPKFAALTVLPRTVSLDRQHRNSSGPETIARAAVNEFPRSTIGLRQYHIPSMAPPRA